MAHSPHDQEYKGTSMKQKQEIWEKNRLEVMYRIANGGFMRFAHTHDEYVKEMSNRLPTCVCCIDGRVAPFYDAVAIAGSGILIKDDPKAKRHLVSILLEKKIKKVTLHEDCGAVSLYAKQKDISIEQAKEDAFEWAYELTKLIGGDEDPKMLEVDQDFHSETCVYVVPDNFSLQGMEWKNSHLTGFMISTSAVSFPHLLQQIEVAISIARGEHSFGEYFTKEIPFTVVIVAHDKKELHNMQLNPEIVKLISEQNGCVVLDGFVV